MLTFVGAGNLVFGRLRMLRRLVVPAQVERLETNSLFALAIAGQTVLSGGKDGSVQRRETNGGDEIGTPAFSSINRSAYAKRILQLDAAVLTLAISDDGHRAAVGLANGCIAMLDGATGDILETPLATSEYAIRGLSFCARGRLVGRLAAVDEVGEVTLHRHVQSSSGQNMLVSLLMRTGEC